jgi:putative spermidine/putrescine transport system substrate-binding protein
LPLHITYGPTNKAAYAIGKIDEKLALLMPSHPKNAALQLPVSLEWYAEFEQQAAAMYQNMLTE